jgi:CheY-like chemotaxis protein
MESSSDNRDRFDKGQPIRILHVEDDLAHAELVRRGFEEHRRPCEIQQVDNGLSALEYLHRQGEFADPDSSPTPDVVLLDLRLPGMDGLEILERIRSDERTAELPVVILTTSEAEHDKLNSYEHHINGYIVKPLDFESFSVLLDVIYLVLTE